MPLIAEDDAPITYIAPVILRRERIASLEGDGPRSCRASFEARKERAPHHEGFKDLR
jgi:hypothetical protein